MTTTRFTAGLTLVTLLLCSGCASEPILSRLAWYSDTATVDDVDRAAARATESLGYIPIAHVAEGDLRVRAVAEGDERYAEVESRERAQAIWIHVSPADHDRVELLLFVLSRDGIDQNAIYARELSDAVAKAVPDLSGPGGGTTGLGYDPKWVKDE